MANSPNAVESTETVLHLNQGNGRLDALLAAIERLKQSAHAAGLTDDLVDEELALHKAQRNNPRLSSANVLASNAEVDVTSIATIEIPVQAETAAALTDIRQKEALGHLIDNIVRPGGAPSPLAAVFDAMARHAREAGLTNEDIDAELAAHKAEGRKT